MYFKPLYLLLFCALTNLAMADHMEKVLKGNNDFAMNLYKTVAAGAGPTENLFMSPISAHTILSLLYQGSTGETEKVMANVLGLSTKEHTAEGYGKITKALNSVEGVTLNTANKIFLNQEVELITEFTATAVNNYDSEAERVNFKENVAAAKIINDWVEDKTAKKIKDLIDKDSLNSDTAMVLVNAIYFKGLWDKQFKKEHTQKKDFYTSETDKQEVDMMYQKSKFRYADNQELDAQVLELPYKSKQVSMLVILPKTRTGIAELEKKLVNYDLANLTKGMYQQEVEVYLPKFKIETTIKLTEILKKMGMEHIFTSAANFSQLTKTPVYVSEAIQKAFIEVNEEGTEAAAATGMIMMMRCMPLPPTVFMADHPFIIKIQHQDAKGSNDLFAGRVSSINV